MNNINNTIQPLYVDLANDTSGTLQNTFNNFISNLTSAMSNAMGWVNPNSVTIIGLWNNLSNIVSTCFAGQLGNWTYAYDTQTLLTLWNNNYNQLALEIVASGGLYLINFTNAYLNALNGNTQTINTVAGNNFGDVNTTAGSTYHVESALNQNNNQTISTINNNFNTSGSNGGGFGYEWNPTSTTSYVNGVNVVNNAMSGDTTPLQKSNGDFQGNTTNNINGIQIATFLQSTFKDFTIKMSEVLYGVFKPYLLPVNDLDNNVEGFNW